MENPITNNKDTELNNTISIFLFMYVFGDVCKTGDKGMSISHPPPPLLPSICWE